MKTGSNPYSSQARYLRPRLLTELAVFAFIPLLAANAHLTPLHTLGVVFVLGGQQTGVVFAVKGLLPVHFEIAVLSVRISILCSTPC